MRRRGWEVWGDAYEKRSRPKQIFWGGEIGRTKLKATRGAGAGTGRTGCWGTQVLLEKDGRDGELGGLRFLMDPSDGIGEMSLGEEGLRMCEEGGVVCGVGCVRKAWKGEKGRTGSEKGESLSLVLCYYLFHFIFYYV